MKKRRPVPIYLENSDKEKLASIASGWGCSLSSAVQRIVREYELSIDSPPKLADVVVNIALSCFKSVRFDDFDLLPEAQGVYVVRGQSGNILYVGKANGRKGLYGRWRGRWSHHRDEEFCLNGAAWIHYLELDESCVASTEAELIRSLSPILNKREEMKPITEKGGAASTYPINQPVFPFSVR